jgi:hypothetical protein
MGSFRTVHEIRVFERTAFDTEELNKALMIFVKNTSSAHRTQANQIQAKFANPNNQLGTFYYLGLYQDDEIVGFAMFGYYPRRRVIVFDHLTIDQSHRKHRAFYVFASLIQECIEERCPEFDFIVSEIMTDDAFADDDVSGRALVCLLRQIGFGRVHVKYALPNMEARSYRKAFQGALMLRGPQKLPEIRRTLSTYMKSFCLSTTCHGSRISLGQSSQSTKSILWISTRHSAVNWGPNPQ